MRNTCRRCYAFDHVCLVPGTAAEIRGQGAAIDHDAGYGRNADRHAEILRRPAGRGNRQKVYDKLDFVRGVEAFLAGHAGGLDPGHEKGYIEGGFPPNEGFGISESLADARSLFLTPNTVVVYGWVNIDVKDGPMVLRGAARRAGHAQRRPLSLRHRPRAVGPDQGKGGKYLVVPPGYTGHAAASEGYFVTNKPPPTATTSSCAPSSRAATSRPS